MKRFRPVLLAAAAAAILALAGAAHARYALGNLAGVVVDSHGNPVADAAVIIQTSYGEYPHATHTDAHGQFIFERYSPGQYDLRASAYGIFTDWSRDVVIRAHRTTHITLHLPAAVK
jgi:protocatechuate 3,4-dioxygenase beta subunit